MPDTLLMTNTNNTMNLTETQKTWLAANKLEVCENSSSFTIKPVGANWVYAPYTEVSQMGDEFQVVQVYAAQNIYAGPKGRIVSRHKTLKAALKAWLAVK